jgi:hypothetical protein
MRRVVFSLVLASVLLSLAGCGGVDNSAVKPENPAPPPTEPPKQATSKSNTAEIP